MPTQSTITTPGVYLETVVRTAPRAFETGVPAFVALASAVGPGKAVQDDLFASALASHGVVELDVSSWSGLEARVGAGWIGGFVGFAVRGFFENGGRRCRVVAPLPGGIAAGLDAIAAAEDIDLVCAPDLVDPNPTVQALRQARLVEFCDGRGQWSGRPPGCFAVLDSIGAQPLSSALTAAMLPGHRDALIASLSGPAKGVNAALYAPWLKVRGACPTCAGTGITGSAGCPTCGGVGAGFVPPSGHVAGIYSRTDRTVGVHKAPANEALLGADDLQITIDEGAQGLLNPVGVNCIRAFPGRGVRVWGARTLSADPAWTFVSVRRLVLTVGRWIEGTLMDAAFEPNDVRLWARIVREVSAFLEGLRGQGALGGGTPAEAYFVKCDAETNPSEVRDAGQVVTEVGLAPLRPNEFIVVRLVSSASNVTANRSA